MLMLDVSSVVCPAFFWRYFSGFTLRVCSAVTPIWALSTFSLLEYVLYAVSDDTSKASVVYDIFRELKPVFRRAISPGTTAFSLLSNPSGTPRATANPQYLFIGYVPGQGHIDHCPGMPPAAFSNLRTEERRGGKEWVSQCRF